MELRPHQQKALDNVNEIFAEDNKAIVVHPTGTGKTYIALELFRQNKDKKMVFVSPSSAIIGQLKVSIAKEFGVKPEEYKKVFPNLEITTYQQINSDFKKSETYAQDFDADLVVFDEAHHTAATEWGKNAKALMSSHPETNFLGLTATPQRPDGIDVVKEVFDGNLADEITLEEAVATGLLKMPNYVTALYSYEPLIEELEAGLEAIQDKYPEKYLMLKKDMEKAKNLLEKSHGLPEIFAKHMVKKDGKYIVFCKDINHLNRMVEAAKTQGWFDDVNENVEILAIHSEEDDKTNAKVLKRFRENHVATDNTLRILFSVEKINEGLHLDDIAGEIMLRPTRSKIVYRQQLGRAMSISASTKKGRAVVFDIVDNIDSFDDIKDFIDGVRELGGGHLDGEEPFDDFYVADEVREARDALRRIAGELEVEWEDFYQRSVKWREEHDGQAPRGNKKDNNEKSIYQWERMQKLKYLKDYQDSDEQDIPEKYREKVKKLKSLGLEYVPSEYKTKEEHFALWKEWTLEHKATPLYNSQDGTESKIANRMTDALKFMRKNPEIYKTILEEYDSLYAQYGIKKDEKTLQEKIDIVEEYVRVNGPDVSTLLILEDGTKIGSFVKTVRTAYRLENLTEEQINQLEKLGFTWRADEKNVSMQEKINIVVDYIHKNGTEIRRDLVLKDGTKLGDYVSYIRRKYKAELLEKEQIKQLNDVGFEFQINDRSNDVSLEEKINIIIVYIKTKGPDIKTNLILKDGTKIGNYVKDVRKAYSNEKLTEEQINQLKEVGFIFKTKNRENEKNMQEKIDIVERYIRENNSDIRTSLILKDGTMLGQYVKNIRFAYSKGKLTKEQIAQLNSVGFVWETSKLKPLQQQKERELAETRQLKTQAEQAETLDTQTQAALDQVIEEQTQKPKGPGE